MFHCVAGNSKKHTCPHSHDCLSMPWGWNGGAHRMISQHSPGRWVAQLISRSVPPFSHLAKGFLHSPPEDATLYAIVAVHGE